MPQHTLNPYESAAKIQHLSVFPTKKMKKLSPLLIFYLPMTNDKALVFTSCDVRLKLFPFSLQKCKIKRIFVADL